MRLRTLPVSIAGVLGGVTVATAYGCFTWLPAVICLLFALAAQIASNFANEYFDYVNGLDKPGRDGFRRGVAEGDITPDAMKRATLLTLAICACLGLSLLIWGGWWLIAAGAVILLGALAYSGGPYPLSHHGLGDIAVVFFYGLVPVFFTAVIQANACMTPWDISSPEFPYPLWSSALTMGLAVGLMGANVLIVNNYRDADDDRNVGKHTTVVILGRPAMRAVYLFDWLCADLLITLDNYRGIGLAFWIGIAIFVILQLILWIRLGKWSGSQLNALLRQTALVTLAVILLTLGCVVF